jgi:iron-sulfur cluster repair protein YtfE (RIC family)
LVNKDKEMSAFIEKYESVRQEHIEANTKLELTIMNLLERIGQHLQKESNLPSVEVYSKMKEDLKYKADQMGRSQTTAQKLQEGMKHSAADIPLSYTNFPKNCNTGSRNCRRWPI